MKQINHTVKQVKRNCSTCIYNREIGCTNEDYFPGDLSLREIFEPCPYYKVDRERFPAADVEKGALV